MEQSSAPVGLTLEKPFEGRGGAVEWAGSLTTALGILILIIIGLLAYGIDRLLFFFQRGLFPYRAVED